MNKKSLNTLEYYKVLELLSNFAQSEITTDSIRKIMPSINYDEVNAMLLDTSDAIELYQRKGHPSLGGITDISGISSRLELGADLSNTELLKIRENLFISRNTIRYLSESNPELLESGKRIKEKLEDLFENRNLETEIQRCILSEDEIADDASPELRNIRISIKRKQDSVRDRLNEYIRSAKYSKFIQDNVITIRNGRYVIPVKQEFRSNIKGLLHDSSASGSTLYIEPMDIVNLNNDIRELESSEKEEMERIRGVLSDASRPFTTEFKCNYKLLVFTDIVFAKASMAMEKNYLIPLLNKGRKVRLVNARHPLIDSKTVVPIDFHIGENFNILVITGPNTGGKTVSLKTVGLLNAMAQSGIPIPAGPGTEICIFKDIFADIGDEQSIEQSLSTFSSHMTNIISILKKCDSDSLVLLDELGAGTDPAEGSALALSIIEKLIEKGSTAIATTHYQQIKIYATVKEGVENASCEFDVSTLKPTYRLLIGIPGKSNALYISRRLGLDQSIIEKAKEFLDNDNVDYEDVILSLEKSRQRIEKEKSKAIFNKKESISIKEDLEKKLKGVEGERTRILNEARRQADDILESSREKAIEFMEEINKLKKEGSIKGSARIEAEFRTKYKEVLEGSFNNEHVNTTKIIKTDNKYIPEPGDQVKIIDMNQKASVIEHADKNNDVLVQAGIMKIKIAASNLQYIKPKTEVDRIVNSFSLDKTGKKPAMELDIRGIASDEVDMKVGKFLDDSAIMSINEVFIIHGKGTGVLRSAVHSYLKKNSHVKSFRLGNFGEGESGVTVVKLK